MKTLVFSIMSLGLVSNACLAQTIWNPNSARSRQLIQTTPTLANPAAAQKYTTIAPSKWGTYGNQIGQSAWGTVGQSNWKSIGANGWQSR